IEEEELETSSLQNDFSYVYKADVIDIANSFKDVHLPDPFNGSNNLVVSGDKTVSGSPLLADDPHLGLATPSIWLYMPVKNEDVNVSGVIFAGVVCILLSHNDYICWGITNKGTDVQQLYIEKRHPEIDIQFRFEDEREEAELISEPIKVKVGETID